MGVVANGGYVTPAPLVKEGFFQRHQRTRHAPFPEVSLCDSLVARLASVRQSEPFGVFLRVPWLILSTVLIGFVQLFVIGPKHAPVLAGHGEQRPTLHNGRINIAVTNILDWV